MGMGFGMFGWLGVVVGVAVIVVVIVGLNKK